MHFSSLLFLLPSITLSIASPLIPSLVNQVAGSLSRVGDISPVKTTTTWDWFDCGSATDAINIKSIRVSPDPPKPGQDLTIFAEGTVKTLIDEGAYADVTVKLGLIKLLTKRFDVCEELGNANATLQCPIVPDVYKIEQTVALPEEIPRAKFLVNALAFTQLDEPMACLTIIIDFLH